MKQTTLANGKKVSVVGIGGHYKHFEYGRYEETYGPVEQSEVDSRAKLLSKAYENGITYYDTTWYNEVEMLARSLEIAGIRSKIHVNGMVLGAFTGSKGFGMTDRDYFNKYLDKRLAIMPENRFDSFMINAIDEQYDYDRCAGLVKLLSERKAAGDIGMLGFSCHNHPLAREIADAFNEFEIIMTPYNFRNNWFARSFDGYKGNASFVAMKPMVWAQYGVPFSVINNLNNFEEIFGFKKDEKIAVKAFRYLIESPILNVTLSSVNNETELDMLIEAGTDHTGGCCLNENDLKALTDYDKAVSSHDSIPLFIGGMKTDNLRAEFFCADNLCNILNIDKSTLTVRDENRRELIAEYKEKIYKELKTKGYGKYL
ncbi:MAG: hypothetical protein FWG69_02735 [Oscillospiraceae bacterium]|nr:hypothetical protein [Oscillospiraceae bacterium]